MSDDPGGQEFERYVDRCLLEIAEARAEAAEKQLAEARAALNKGFGSSIYDQHKDLSEAITALATWCRNRERRVASLKNHSYDQGKQLVEAQRRITQLERLVPEAALLRRLANDAYDAAAAFTRGGNHSAARRCRDDGVTSTRLAFAIQDYREGK